MSNNSLRTWALLALALTLAGCFDPKHHLPDGCLRPLMPDRPVDCLYEPALHLHNNWHEVLPNGTLVAYTTFVNSMNASQEISSSGVNLHVLTLALDEDRFKIGDRRFENQGELSSRTSRESAFQIQIPPKEPDWAHRYDIAITFGPGYSSPCYRDDEIIVSDDKVGRCWPSYTLGTSGPSEDSWIDEDTWTRIYLRPDDVRYKRFVWSCCELRSLPDYDANESFTIPTTGNISFSRGFPVQDGAVDGVVTARLRTPPPVSGLVAGNLSLVIVDDEGREVSRSEANVREGVAEVRFEDVRSFGVWHAVVEARGVPTGSVDVEIHVRDALPDGEFPSG